MRKLTCGLIAGFLFLSLFATSKGTLAAPYYEGKVMTIVVGTSPGGGYDRMARLLAKHLPKYIPGKPTIIVENMAGADGMKTANYIYNSAKADGLTLGTFQRGLPGAQLLKVEGARFDLMKYSWVGSAAVEVMILSIRTDLPYKSFADLSKAKKEIYMAGAGPENIESQLIPIYNEYLKLNLKNVYYPSSADGMLAIERKEVDGKIGSYSSLKRLIDRKLLLPLLRGRVSEPGIENLLVNEDLTTDKTGKIIMSMISSMDKIGRPYVAPPATPPEIMAILRNAFIEVAKDAELKEDSEKLQMRVEYVSAGECLQVLNHILNQPKDIVEEFIKHMRKLGL